MTSGLIEKVGAIHSALTEADLPHAFGGALALAWCVGDPRATIDVDINVFIAEADAALLRSALPSGVALSDSDIARLEDEAVREILVASLGESDERVRALDRLAETGRAFRP